MKSYFYLKIRQINHWLSKLFHSFKFFFYYSFINNPILIPNSSNQQSAANFQIIGHNFGHPSGRMVHQRGDIWIHLFLWPNGFNPKMAYGRLCQCFCLFGCSRRSNCFIRNKVDLNIYFIFLDIFKWRISTRILSTVPLFGPNLGKI